MEIDGEHAIAAEREWRRGARPVGDRAGHDRHKEQRNGGRGARDHGLNALNFIAIKRH
jgi:hypothetical protein